jgi:acyl-coenzyme A synthetase/AMP-(fatty) acid ligase
MPVKSGKAWRTVPEILQDLAACRPQEMVMADSDGMALTAAELLSSAQRGAYLLARAGVRRSDFVAVDTSSLGWAQAGLSYFAVTWLGAAAVMTTGAGTATVARDRIGVAAWIAGGQVPAPGAVTFTPAELARADGHCEVPQAQPGDRLDLVFTSGTTGAPKAVESTHAQWTRSVRPEIMASPGTRVVAHTGVPIAVSGGLHGVLLNHLARGVRSIQAGTVAGLVDACARHDVRELHLTPHSARALTRHLRADQPWTSRIRVIRVVGGPVPSVVAHGLAERFPVARVVSLYGLTEGGAALCVRRLDHRAPDVIGRPVPGTEVCVLGPDGRELPAGQVGELAVRATGTALLSYYREDLLNQEWFPDSWARTGDMGFVDPQGNVRLVGRGKELIFLRGGRVGPETIEEILSGAIPPGVDFAVAGVGSAGSWDRIAVFLGGRADDPQVMRAVRELAAVKGPFRPDVVHVRAEIPRGPFGKPLRRLLVQELAAGGS